MPNLRPYQLEAKQAVFDAFTKFQRVLVSLPTGTGKTILSASIVNEFPGRILWLAQRDELIWQAAEAIAACTGEEPAIEKGQQRIKDTARLFDRRVVVSSNQTMLSDDRRLSFGPAEFSLVVQDEAAHAVAPGHMKVLDYFSAAKLLGISATCDRADEVSLGKVFQHVAYHYEILDAVRDGWLAPIRQEFIEDVSLDFSRVNLSDSGDFSASDLEQVINQEQPLHKIASSVVQLATNRQTIIFTPSVATAESLAELLRRYGKTAMALSGSTPEEERRREVDNYKERRFQFLVNCTLFTEGFDAPATSCIVIARPTKSRALYAQCLDSETEVLTDAGWKGIESNWESGVKAAAYDIDSGTVSWSDCSRMERRLGYEEMWGVLSPHLDIRVTAGHRMVARKRRTGGRRFSPSATGP